MLRSTRSVQPQLEQELPFANHFDALNIRYRVCYKFRPKRNDDKTCVCNRPENVHTKRTENLEENWKMETHTSTKRYSQPGQLSNGALFARLALDTKLKKVEDLLLAVWKIPKPKLIMSINGGAKYFTLTDRFEANFINGIINVAIKSDIWIITNGYKCGVVQLVGQAIKQVKLKKPEQKLIAIAVCKWGSIRNVKEVTGLNKETKQENTNDSNDSDDQDTKAPESGESDLEMNHTHYLMFDDGRYRYFDTKDVRSLLCRQISKLDSEDDFHTPVVSVVVEGGRSTLTNIYYDLKNNIPVVIIDGSGRVADFMSRSLLHTKEFDSDMEQRKKLYGIDELYSDDNVKSIEEHFHFKKSAGRYDVYIDLREDKVDPNTKKLHYVFDKYKTQLKNDLQYTLYHDDDDDDMTKIKLQESSTKKHVDELLDQVMYCLQPAVRSNITVFKLDSDNDLSETIIRCVCKSYKNLTERKKLEPEPKPVSNVISDNVEPDDKKKKQAEDRTPLLELAMDWNCIDVAKELILQNSLDNISDPIKAFKNALTKYLHTFIYEFIKMGINPVDVYFPGDVFIKGPNRYAEFIKDLYDNEMMKEDETHLKSFIEDSRDLPGKEINLVGALNVILRDIIGDYMHKLYFDRSVDEEEDRIKNGLIKRLEGTKQKKSNEIEEKQPIAYDYIMRDLFLWAVLMNRIDMAKVLLSHMKYRICPALIATKILNRYYEKAIYGELKEGYKKSAAYFEQYAIDCINKCVNNDANEACQIVLQQNKLYGYVTCLQVAADAKDKLFIATPCCVEAMYNIWYDKLHPEQKRKRDQLALFFGFISLGLLAPSVVPYREVESAEKGETLKPILRSNGINYCDPYRLEFPRYFKSQLEINRYIHQVKNFHLSLVMKFYYHFIFYLFFLLLFSYVLLFNFNPPTGKIPSIHWTEILTIMLVSCMLIEEVRYFLTQDSLTFLGKSEHYFRDLFKYMTVLGFLLFYIGLIVRFTYADSEENFTAARIIMAIDIEIWWLRFLTFIIVIPYLGPLLISIVKMLQDLLFFTSIIAIVMIGYGVASRSMVYYPIVNNFTTATGGFIDTSFDGRNVFRQIIYPVYYFLYGRLDDELANLDSNPNAGWSIATQVLLAIHMLFVNILLFNLLIAMFSKRFDQVYDDIHNIWHYQQYIFTREYYTRSPFVPPISLIYDIYYLCRMFVFYIRQKYSDKPGDYRAKVFKMIAKNESLEREWYKFEGASTYEYAHAEVKAAKDASTKSSSEQDSSNVEENANVTEKKNDSDNVLDNLKQIKDTVGKLTSSMEGMKGEFQKVFKDDNSGSQGKPGSNGTTK